MFHKPKHLLKKEFNQLHHNLISYWLTQKGNRNINSKKVAGSSSSIDKYSNYSSPRIAPLSNQRDVYQISAALSNTSLTKNDIRLKRSCSREVVSSQSKSGPNLADAELVIKLTPITCYQNSTAVYKKPGNVTQ